MIFRKLSLVAAVAIAAMASAASAATITLVPVIQQTYDSTGLVNQGAGFINDGQPHIYRVAITTKITGQGANESWGAASYDITLSGGLARNTVTDGGVTTGLTRVKPNYVNDSTAINNPALFDSVGPVPDYYANGKNGDLGLSTSDFIAITTAIDPANLGDLTDIDGNPAADPRQTIGVAAAGTRLGVVYVKWNGTVDGVLSLVNASVASAQADTNKFNNSVPTTVAPLILPAVPEPASVVLMGFAASALPSRLAVAVRPKPTAI